MKSPIWEKPLGYNPTEAEGRQAFKEGRAMTDHPYGECVAAKDFERGWRAAEIQSRG